jgi:hypothetical protein
MRWFVLPLGKADKQGRFAFRRMKVGATRVALVMAHERDLGMMVVDQILYLVVLVFFLAHLSEIILVSGRMDA